MQGEKLPTTRDLYERLKSLSGKETAYGVAKHFGWNPGTVRRWEKGHCALDVKHVNEVADALGLDRGFVGLCIAVESTNDANLAADMARFVLQPRAA